MRKTCFLCRNTGGPPACCCISAEPAKWALLLFCAGLWSREKRFGVPYCPPGDGAMFFCRIDSTEELKPGRYGILEPDPKKSLDHTDWQTALCLVPGIAFDRLGYRLGYGKGYYDRFLAGKKIVAAGLCYRELVQQELPREPHDQRVQILITEDGSFAVSPQCPERKEFYGRSQ